MLEKNYTNPEGIGRFSFSEGGEYRAPYKGEGIGVFLTILIALILETAVVMFSLTLMHDWLGEYEDANRAAMFVSMTSAIVIAIGSIIIFCIYGVIIARIYSGMSCKYSATEDTFVAIVGGDTYVIKYDQVQSITFSPKYFLGKVKGYDIEILAANKLEHFGVSFRGQYQSEKSTPFYIIKERVEIIQNRRADEMAQFAQQKIGADKPISQNEIDRARLRKQHSNDVFPPTSSYQEKIPGVDASQAAPTMDSIAPKSTSRPKMAGVEPPKAADAAAAAAAMQMPELKAKASSSVPWGNGASGNSQDTQSAADAPSSSMSEITPKNKRPSSELLAAQNPDNSDDSFTGEVKSLSDREDYDEVADIADLADYADVVSAIDAENTGDIEDVEDTVTDEAVMFVKSSVKPDAEELKKTNDTNNG